MEENVKLSDYCSAAAKTICDSAYEKTKSLNGEDILSLSPVTQLNMMVIKRIFMNWKKQLEKSRSPYFNYNSQEVAEAQKKYANALSRNILIERQEFEPLLKNSICETLLLIYSPYNFILQTLSLLKEKEIDIAELKDTQKYLKVNRGIVKGIIEVAEQGDLGKDNPADLTDRVLQKVSEEPADTLTFTDLFRSIHKFNPEEIFASGEEIIEKEKEGKEDIKASPEKEKQKSEEITRSILNDMYQTQQKETIADRHEKSIESIKKSLTLNQRFMFINNLFEGDAEKFNDAINHIDSTSNYQEAFEYLNSHFSWDDDQEGLEEFLSLVNKKFNR